MKLNQKQIVKLIRNNSRCRIKDIKIVLNSLKKVIEDELSNGNSISLIGFGIFTTYKRSKMIIPHPLKPKESLLIGEKIITKFKPARQLKNKVNRTSTKVANNYE